jgi:26S proteasome regulatory subunit N6
MMMCKIMMDLPADVYTLVNGKAGVKFAGAEVASMKAVADAYKQRSIAAFDETYSAHGTLCNAM